MSPTPQIKVSRVGDESKDNQLQPWIKVAAKKKVVGGASQWKKRRLCNSTNT